MARVQLQFTESGDGTGASVDVSRGVEAGNPGIASVSASAHANASYNTSVSVDQSTGIETITTAWNGGLDTQTEITLAHNPVNGRVEIIDVTYVPTIERDEFGNAVSETSTFEINSDITDFVEEVAEGVQEGAEVVADEIDRVEQQIDDVLHEQPNASGYELDEFIRFLTDEGAASSAINPGGSEDTGSIFGDAEIHQSLSSFGQLINALSGDNEVLQVLQAVDFLQDLSDLADNNGTVETIDGVDAGLSVVELISAFQEGDFYDRTVSGIETADDLANFVDGDAVFNDTGEVVDANNGFLSSDIGNTNISGAQILSILNLLVALDEGEGAGIVNAGANTNASFNPTSASAGAVAGVTGVFTSAVNDDEFGAALAEAKFFGSPGSDSVYGDIDYGDYFAFTAIVDSRYAGN